MVIPAERQTRFAWSVVLLLFLGSVLNYMDRTVLGVVKTTISEDLGISNTEYGFAVNAFLVSYAVLYVTGGRLADWLGYRRMFSVTVIFWSAASMLHAATLGIRSLCLFRGLLGVGEGGFYPTAMRGASEWFPPKQRAKAVGILLCGVSFGTLITPPIVAWITSVYGWRAAFLITGALGTLLVPPWLLLHRRIRRVFGTSDPAPARDAILDDGSSEETPLNVVLRHRKYWCILFARAFTDSAWYFYLFWIPGYFQEVRGFDLRMVGWVLWFPYFMADLGAIGGAWTSTALIKRGFTVDRGRKTVLIPAALLASVGGLTFYADSAWTAVMLVSLALFAHQAWSSNIHTIITEITPTTHVAVLYGITGAAGTLMGALTEPILGYLVDTTGYAPAFGYAGGVYFMAIVLLLSAGKIERIRGAVPPDRAGPPGPASPNQT